MGKLSKQEFWQLLRKSELSLRGKNELLHINIRTVL